MIMARRFRAEWSSLLKELVDINQVPEESVQVSLNRLSIIFRLTSTKGFIQDCRTLHLFRYKLGYDKNCFRFGAELSSLGQNRATKGIGPVAIFACHDDASGGKMFFI